MLPGSIEDRAYCGVKLHLAVGVVELDVGMVAIWVPYYCFAAVCCLSLPLLLLLLYCFCLCLCFLARVSVLGHRRGTALGHTCGFVFACVYQCLLARVGVLDHRRGTTLGHPCGMPPTGTNIAVLILKT